MNFDRLVLIIPLRLRSLFHRRAIDAELDEELQYHVERQTEENIRRGLAPDVARKAALIAMGGVAFRKDQMRDVRGVRWLEELVSDVKVSFRNLTHAPGYTATVVLTLALGIGANTAMFTLLRGTLLRPLPNRAADRVLYLRQDAPGAARTDTRFSVPEVVDYRARSKTVAEFAEYSSAVPFTLVDDKGQPSRATVGIVSGDYFDVVGLGAVLGRVMNSHDDGAAAAPVAVLTYGFWMDHFGGDPHIIGRPLRLNDLAVTVVGVAEPAPRFPDATDVFANTVTSPHHLSATMTTLRTHRMSEVFARLRPTSTVQQARTELQRIAADMFRAHPDAYEAAAQYAIGVQPLRTALNERAALTVWLLMAAAGFVLLIACANVSNVTLMRSVGREREMVIRTALGAGRGRLRRLLAAENLLLALAGGALGVLVAYSAVRLLVAFAAQFSPRADEIHVDGMVLAVGLASALLAAVGLALVHPLDGSPAVATSLAPAARRATLEPRRRRVQRSLVIGQVAISMVLVTCAGLLARTIAKLQTVETGLRMDHVITVELPLPGDILQEALKQSANLTRYDAMRDRVAAIPGVDGVALAVAPPLRPSIIQFEVKAEGRPLAPNEPTPRAPFRPVDPGYFGAVALRILRGRGFQATDRIGSPRVAIVSQAFARQLFGDADPIGRRIAPTGEILKVTPFTDEWRTIVGVVGDAREDVESSPTPTVYEPFAQELILSGALVLRTASDPAAIRPTIVRAIHAVAPQQLVEHVETLDQIRDESVAPRRLNALFVAVFGGLALAIAMIGIAGVLAFSVRSRTAEIGIRMSLGADAARVRGMVLGEGGALLLAGVAIGLVGALFATRVLRSLLFGISAHDPFTLGAAAIGLAAVGLTACWVPAARAAHVDPAVTLRAE